MSKRWSDEFGGAFMPPFFDEFGAGLLSEMNAIFDQRGGAFGCACADRVGIDRWFTATEQPRLARLGYRIVSIAPDIVLRESDNQVVFWRKLPLSRGVIVIPWRVEARAA
jgi:hypothetical protein